MNKAQKMAWLIVIMMNKAQKMAWLIVIMILLAVLLSGVAVGILYVKLGTPMALAGLGFLGIAGFGGLGPLIFRKDEGSVTCDERDRLIHRRAALCGFRSSLHCCRIGVYGAVLCSGTKQFDIHCLAANGIWRSGSQSLFCALSCSSGSVLLGRQRK